MRACGLLAAAVAAALVLGCSESPPPKPLPDPQARPLAYMRQYVRQGCTGVRKDEDVRMEQVRPNVWQVTARQKLGRSSNFAWIKDKALACYGAIFSSQLHVESATIETVLDLVDRFGNPAERVVHRAAMQRGTAPKVNWKNTLNVDLSRVADETHLHPAVRD